MITGGFIPTVGFVQAASSAAAAATPPSVWGAFASTRGPDGTQPSTTSGTAITPGTTGTMGSYASMGVLHASVDMIELELVVHTAALSTSNRMLCADLAYDPLGGTSYTVPLVTNLLLGSPGALSAGAESRWVFHLRVPAGASLGMRAVSLDATVTAIRAFVNGWGSPSQPTLVRYGTAVQSLGVTVTPGVSFAGTGITPGTASEGAAWADLGALSQAIFAIELGVHINNTVIGSNQFDFDVAIGDAGTKTVVISNRTVVATTNEAVYRQSRFVAFCSASTGQHVYVRAQASGVQTGVEAAAYGVY